MLAGVLGNLTRKRFWNHTPPLQAAPNTPTHHQGNVTQAPPPEMHCLSCNSQAQWLPNGQLWCPQCQTVLEVRTNLTSEQVVGGLLGLLVILFGVLFALYIMGLLNGLMLELGLAEYTHTNPYWGACYEDFLGNTWCEDF